MIENAIHWEMQNNKVRKSNPIQMRHFFVTEKRMKNKTETWDDKYILYFLTKRNIKIRFEPS